MSVSPRVRQGLFVAEEVSAVVRIAQLQFVKTAAADATFDQDIAFDQNLAFNQDLAFDQDLALAKSLAFDQDLAFNSIVA